MDNITITQEELSQIGYLAQGASAEEVLTKVNDDLAERIGVQMVGLLDKAQSQEFLELVDSGDDEQLLQFIETYLPDYQEVMQDEKDIFLSELAQANQGENQ